MDAKHLESHTQKVITEDRSFSWDDVSNEILRVVSRVHCEPVFSLTAGMTDVEYICHICTLGKNNHHRSSRLAEGLGGYSRSWVNDPSAASKPHKKCVYIGMHKQDVCLEVTQGPVCAAGLCHGAPDNPRGLHGLPAVKQTNSLRSPS